MDALYAAGILGLIALLFWAAARHNEIFRVRVRSGRVTVVRGKVPPSFLGDLRELARGVEDGTVRAVKRDGQAHLVVSPSIDERTAQRLRNAFALNPSRTARSRL